MGSALFARDIRDYYRNFILSPYSWWKTYAFALGAYWFNPYMPFGGSSCTSLAQRQSDAIRLAATVTLEGRDLDASIRGPHPILQLLPIERVQSAILPMLDDFLGVLPRQVEDSDRDILNRAKTDVARFDSLLAKLGLPRATEKDQDPAFSTIWFGIEYFSKEQNIGIPKKKWRKLRQFIENKFMTDDGTVKAQVDAADLLSGLGKLHHMTQVLTAGRPRLYSLWVMLSRATFSSRKKLELSPKKQMLKVSPEAARAIAYWHKAVSRDNPPKRSVLPCSRSFEFVTLDICLIKEFPRSERPLWVQVPSAWWRRPMALMGKIGKPTDDSPPEAICIFMEVLQEGVEVMDIPDEAKAIIVRTNITQLATSIDKNLYVKSIQAAKISELIHEHLQNLGQRRQSKTNLGQPVELRSVLIRGGTPHPLD